MHEQADDPKEKARNNSHWEFEGEVLTTENLKYVYENVEKTIAKTMHEVPEELKQKRHQHEKVQADTLALLEGEVKGLNWLRCRKR